MVVANLEVSTDEVILSCKCEEPEGTFTREVRLFEFSPSNMQNLYKAAQRYITIFAKNVKGDLSAFVNLFLREGPAGIQPTGIIWVVDDFTGIYYITNIHIRVDAICHFIFFDGRFKGRVELSKVMLKYIFDEFEFRRLSTEIPLYHTIHARAHAEKVGFRKEGRKRAAALFGQQWFDVNLYGILREELED